MVYLHYQEGYDLSKIAHKMAQAFDYLNFNPQFQTAHKGLFGLSSIN